eukprot:760962-Hanusia_phi.AAC.1
MCWDAGGAVLALQPEERCVKIAMRGPGEDEEGRGGLRGEAGSLLFYSSEKPQQVKHGEEVRSVERGQDGSVKREEERGEGRGEGREGWERRGRERRGGKGS